MITMASPIPRPETRAGIWAATGGASTRATGETFVAAAPRPGSFTSAADYREALAEFQTLQARGMRLQDARRQGLV